MQQFRDYEVIEEIGHGGMGVVYRAKHKLLGEKVALKVIHEHLLRADDATVKARFVQEATLMAKLDHPNIVKLRNCFEEDGRLVIVCELLDGTPLDEILADDRPLPMATRLYWLRQLVNGVSFAHRQNVIHRDLKPANLFISRDDQLKILDFGLGKDLSSDARMTSTGQILGTPAYLPPETYRVKNKVPIRDVGKKGDVFAVGVIAYRMLSGHLPFNMDEGLSATEVFTLLAVNYNGGKAIDPLAIRDKALSPALTDAVMNCLALDPNDRPETLLELQDALTEKPAVREDAPLPTNSEPTRPDNSLTGLETYFEVSQPSTPLAEEKTAGGASPSVPARTSSKTMPTLVKMSLVLGVTSALFFNFYDAQLGLTASDEVNTAADGEDSRDHANVDWIYSRPAEVAFTKTEITLGEYKKCAAAGVCEEKNHQTKNANKNCIWGYSDRDDHPMNCVSWYGAKQFCEWIGGRLPTEEEWYAEASNSGDREWAWGDSLEFNCDHTIWGDGNETDGCGIDSTWPVCSKTRGNSVSGLCDMTGNVWEWTSYKVSSGFDTRVLRGGSWNDDSPDTLRVSHRIRFYPDVKYDSFGFRCVRSSP